MYIALLIVSCELGYIMDDMMILMRHNILHSATLLAIIASPHL